MIVHPDNIITSTFTNIINLRSIYSSENENYKKSKYIKFCNNYFNAK